MELNPIESETLSALLVLHPPQTLPPTTSPLTNSPLTTTPLTSYDLKLQLDIRIPYEKYDFRDNVRLRHNVYLLHTTIPEPFHPCHSRSLQFYCSYLDPYLCHAVCAAREDMHVRVLKQGIERAYPQPMNAFPRSSVLLMRLKRGLLRRGQIRLVEIRMAVLEDELRGIMEEVKLEEGELEAAQIFKVLVRMFVAIEKFHRMMSNFLDSGGFRSERLENTLLRYLAEEEEVNIELVEKLDKINWDKIMDDPNIESYLVRIAEWREGDDSLLYE